MHMLCVCVSVCDTCMFPLVLEEHTILTLELNAMVQIIANISFNFLGVFPKNTHIKKIKDWMALGWMQNQVAWNRILDLLLRCGYRQDQSAHQISI